MQVKEAEKTSLEGSKKTYREVAFSSMSKSWSRKQCKVGGIPASMFLTKVCVSVELQIGQ